MKKILLLTIPFVIIAVIAGFASYINNSPEKISSQKPEIQLQKSIKKTPPSGHPKDAFNCKTCHLCEYPTKNDPCLIACPRKDMTSVYHSPLEGPEIVVIDKMSDIYSSVIFSHRLHSQMSEFTSGCTGCHHYNTTGPVLSCKQCHSNSRQRTDVSVPDLKAAYHRQCLTCHKQWSHENGCNTQCHVQKEKDSEERQKQLINDIKGKLHPMIPEPSKMVWETEYENGKIVTFYHTEHFSIFKIGCNKCHSNDNCIKCHESKQNVDYSSKVKIRKSFDEHHKPCYDCHSNNNCQKCHRNAEMTPFNHGMSTGWTLNSYHNKLECSRCHGNNLPFKRLSRNCTNCHKNFVMGSFNHKITGIVLSEVHIQMECNSCHTNGDFNKQPTCGPCHDDKTYPSSVPGTKRR